MVSSFLTIILILSMFLPIISRVLSLLLTLVTFSGILVFMEIIVVVLTLLAISVILLDYHLIINRQEYSAPIANTPLTVFIPYIVCLAIIQMFYERQGYRIYFIFTTNLITLLLTLLTFKINSVLQYVMPVPVYYCAHTFVLTVCDIFYWDHDKISAFIRKQTWITKMDLLQSMLPKKNINAYILSSGASFCYSSLNMRVQLSYKSMAIPEYVALGCTCTLLMLSGIITFALLVQYADAWLLGCLLIHYIVQAYKRCENLISGTVDLKPKFTFRTFLFAIIAVINRLGSAAFGVAVVPFFWGGTASM